MNGLVSALVGALIGGGFTLVGVWYGAEVSRRRNALEEKRNILAFLQGIAEELDVIWKGYLADIGDRFESSEGWSDGFVDLLWDPPAHQTSFYLSNGILIGRLENEKLRGEIIKSYISFERLIALYLSNNRSLIELQSESYDDLRKFYGAKQVVVEFYDSLREVHRETGRLIIDTTSIIRGEIKKIGASLDLAEQDKNSKRSSNLVSAISIVIALFALLFGVGQHRETQILMRETKAAELFLRYSEIKLENDASSADPALINATSHIIETIYYLTEGDESWNSAVLWMLEQEKAGIQSNLWDCASRGVKFVELATKHIDRVCAPSSSEVSE